MGDLADITDIEVVGVLSEAVGNLIDLAATARFVRIHPATIAHIRAGRSARDAALAFANLRGAIERPQMIGVEIANYKRVRIIHRVDNEARWLCVALKLVLAVDSKSKVDELWVSTAYAIGGSLKRIRGKSTAWHITTDLELG